MPKTFIHGLIAALLGVAVAFTIAACGTSPGTDQNSTVSTGSAPSTIPKSARTNPTGQAPGDPTKSSTTPAG